MRISDWSSDVCSSDLSSTKSMTGHLLGAAGGVEAVFSAMALHTGLIPPTINLDNPSEGCDLDYVPHTAREKQVDVAMSNSFGFGGTNGPLVFRRARGRGAGGTEHFERPLRHPMLRIAYRRASPIPEASHPNAHTPHPP